MLCTTPTCFSTFFRSTIVPTPIASVLVIYDATGYLSKHLEEPLKFFATDFEK